MSPFDFEFMRNAYAAAGMVAVTAGVAGYFLVLRGQSFAGHALGHVGFAGAAGALLFGLPPLAGLIVVSTGGGMMMGLLGEGVAERDVGIGLVLAGALALGLLFLGFFTASASQATALLFGNVLGVDAHTLWALLWVSLFTLVVLAFMARPLLFASLQPELAEAHGVRVRLLSVMFLGVIGLVVAGAAQVVGVLLVFSLLVAPAAAAQRATPRVLTAIALSVALALAEGLGGVTLAFYTDWPASFWITALGVAFYGAAFMAKWRAARD